MKPEVHIFGISIKTFGVMFALGFLACGAVVARRLRELGKPVDWAYEIVFAALIGGVVGARGYYVIQNYESVKHDLLGDHLLRLRPGLVRRRDRRRDRRDRLDALAPRARPRDVRHVRDGARARLRDRADRLPGLRRRRLRDPLEPAVGDGLSARHRADPARRARPADADLRDGHDVPARLLLWQLRDRVRPGVVFALYLVFSGLERLLVEFIRRNNEVVGWADGAAARERRADASVGASWLLALLLASRGGVAGRSAATAWPEAVRR